MGAPSRTGWTCGQKSALLGSLTTAALSVAGPDPDSTAGPGDSREAREALVLHLTTSASAHPRRSHLSACVSLHSSLRKKPTLRCFAMAGCGSEVVAGSGFPGRPATMRWEQCSVGGVGARVALLGPMGRAASMVAPSGFGLPALRQEGWPSRGWTAPTTAWVDRVGNDQGTVDHGPLSLRSHVFVSIERDLGRFAKRLCAWMFPPEVSCEVVQDSTNPGP